MHYLYYHLFNNFIIAMDSRLYHYEYRRPRHNNPTYSSYNVNSSMTFFMNKPNVNGSSICSDVLRKSTTYEQSHNLRNSGYELNTGVQTTQSEPYERTRANSNLSNYGTSSLAFNEREIYSKQNNKFNIINLKPKEVPDRIKQYPKLTLEDKDKYYFQKVQMMREEQREQGIAGRNGSLPARQESVVAGKHTFGVGEATNPGYQQGRYFTPKMLNHADEVGLII